MTRRIKRIEYLSEDDKLWELYLHALAGRRGNQTENHKQPSDVAKSSLGDAQSALRVWNNRKDVVSK